MSVRVGDVVRTRIIWGPLPTSQRNTCPRCRRFVANRATSCECGVRFDYIAEGVAEVISLGA